MKRPWNKGKKGVQIPWNKGVRGEEFLKHYKNRRLGPPPGFKHTPEEKQKISENLRKTISQMSLEEKIKKYSIPHIGEKNCNWKRGKKGKDNPNWRGGISNEPYGFDFNEETKEFIRYRDDGTCRVCGEDAKCVHHIDYNKNNNNSSNLVILCNSCNSRVNFHRDYWKKIFTDPEFLKQEMEKCVRKYLPCVT